MAQITFEASQFGVRDLRPLRRTTEAIDASVNPTARDTRVLDAVPENQPSRSGIRRRGDQQPAVERTAAAE